MNVIVDISPVIKRLELRLATYSELGGYGFDYIKILSHEIDIFLYGSIFSEHCDPLFPNALRKCATPNESMTIVLEETRNDLHTFLVKAIEEYQDVDIRDIEIEFIDPTSIIFKNATTINR